MNIIVPIKQVPATETPVSIEADSLRVVPADDRWIMNPYDELAVEEGLRLTETHGGSVTVMSVGSETCLKVIREALAMGANRGVLILNDSDIPPEKLDVAMILARVIASRPYDLIITGHRSVDMDTHWVGTALAEYLNIPGIPMVTQLDVSAGRICCHQYLEKGYRILEAPLPAVITTQRGLNTPRYVSLPGIKKARNKPIETIPVTQTGLDRDILTQTIMPLAGFETPAERPACHMISNGTPDEKAARLVQLLRDEAGVV